MSDGALWGLGIGVVIVAAIVALAIDDDNKWQRFVAQHDCKVFAEISSSSSLAVGFSSNGGSAVVPVYTPGKTGYRCNDGKEYWR